MEPTRHYLHEHAAKVPAEDAYIWWGIECDEYDWYITHGEFVQQVLLIGHDGSGVWVVTWSGRLRKWGLAAGKHLFKLPCDTYDRQ